MQYLTAVRRVGILVPLDGDCDDVVGVNVVPTTVPKADVEPRSLRRKSARMRSPRQVRKYIRVLGA
jgi:hypothetical protein